MKKLRIGNGVSTDAILLSFIKLITILLGFVVTRLLSEHLSVYDYGTYSQIQIVVSTVTTLTILGMVDGINYFYCGETDMDRREAYISTLFTLQCVISVIAGSVILLLGKMISESFHNPDVRRLMIFAALLPCMQNLLSMLQVLIVSVGKAKMLAIRNLVVSLARLGAVILVITLIQDVAVILLVTLLLDILQILIFSRALTQSGCRIRFWKTDAGLIRRIFQYCAPMAVFTIVSTLNRDLDKYLIATMTDPEVLAVYANASKVLPFDIIMISFSTVLVPQITRRIAEKNYSGATQVYKLFLEIAFLSTAILCCAALAVAPQFLQLLYSEKYSSGLSVFCIYILVDLLRFTNLTMVLASAGKTKLLMRLGFGALASNAVLNVCLYHLLGVAGPAVATLLVTAGMGLAVLKFGAIELHTTIRYLFDNAFLLRFMIGAGVVALLFTLLRCWLQTQAMSYFAILLVVGGGCGICLLLLYGKRLMIDFKQVNSATRE